MEGLKRYLLGNYEEDIVGIRNLFYRKGYKFFDGQFNINLIGIRTHERAIDKFSDMFLMIYRDHLNNWQIERAIGTTVPGRFYHYHHTNPKGVGIIVPGQYRGAFTPGKHKGADALIQNSTFKVYRDSDKDGKIDKEVIEDASPSCRFDFHNAKSTVKPGKIFLENIGKFSAGCQVLANWVQYEEWLAIIKYSMRIYKCNTVTYTLLDEEDLVE